MLSYAQRIRLRDEALPGQVPAQQASPAVTPDQNPLLGLQRSIGNRHLTQLLTAEVRHVSPVTIQARASGPVLADAHEREADRVADEVTSHANAPVRGSGEKTASLRSLRAVDTGSIVASPAVKAALGSPGVALDPMIRAHMEPKFGYEFSAVRVHADAKAAESARGVGALAYTVGSHIAFDAGKFAPNSPAGRHLLAHELTHVVQQGKGGVASLDRAAKPGAGLYETARPHRALDALDNLDETDKGLTLVTRLFAKGHQIYASKYDEKGGCYSWDFVAPKAKLFDEKGEFFGDHFGGPTWTSKRDGSSVVANQDKKIAVGAPESTAVPWLQLPVKHATGNGVFGNVVLVRRVETIGGQAPACKCSANMERAEVPAQKARAYGSRCPTSAFEELQVPYQAVYYFFRKTNQG